jgi:Membrane domain of glycerophosphoryl diester phosphodiesterase
MSDNPWPGAPGEPDGGQSGQSGQSGQPGQSEQPGYGQPGGYPRYGQPPSGQPGYGQPPYSQPGYGHPYGLPNAGQAAPQPGGIPLRPMGVGEILSGAFTSIRQNPAATLGLSAILLTLYGVISTAGSLIVRNLAGEIQLPAAAQQLTEAETRHLAAQLLTVALPTLLIVVVLAFLIETVLTSLLTVVIGRGVLGRKVTMGQAWRIGRSRLPAVLGAWLLGGVIIASVWVALIILIIILAAAHAGAAAALLGVLGSLAAVCLTVWLAVSFSLAAPVVVLEDQGPATALRRSLGLVRRSFWRVFGIFLLTLLIVFIASAVLQVPFALIERFTGGSTQLFGLAGHRTVAAVLIAAVGSIIAGAVTRPISAGVTVLLYLDLRMRKEGLDLALQDAAQGRQLTGDEFGTLWRPAAGSARPWPPVAGGGGAWPPTGGGGAWPPPAGPGPTAPPSW